MHLNFHKYKNLNKIPVYLLSKIYNTYLYLINIFIQFDTNMKTWYMNIFTIKLLSHLNKSNLYNTNGLFKLKRYYMKKLISAFIFQILYFRIINNDYVINLLIMSLKHATRLSYYDIFYLSNT